MEKGNRPTIGILITNEQTEYIQELVYGFCVCAKEEDVNLLFMMRSRTPDDGLAIPGEMQGENLNIQFASVFNVIPQLRVDALIVAYGSLCVYSGIPSKEELIRMYRDTPMIFIEDTSDDPDVPSLVAENYKGMKTCVEHLVLDHGYEKIAFLSGPSMNHDSNERLQAYRDVMTAHGLEIKDTMIAYGNYSEHDDPQVEYLLENNPGLEAIVCANDNMAKAVYRVCQKYNLMVGKDLAVTGFDDVNIAKTMNPPLTSVAHSSFLFSYQAIKNALQKIKGEYPRYYTTQTELRCRNSCGCNQNPHHCVQEGMTLEGIEKLIESRTRSIAEHLYASTPYTAAKLQCLRTIREYFFKIYEAVFVKEMEPFMAEELYGSLQDLCDDVQITNRNWAELFVDLLKELSGYAWNEVARNKIGTAIAETRKYVHSADIWEFQNKINLAERQKWFLTSFLRDVMSEERTMQQDYRMILSKIRQFNVKSAYLFLFKEPVQRTAYGLENIPPLYLAAYFDQKGEASFNKHKWINIGEKNGIQGFLDKSGNKIYTSYMIFSRNDNYGMLVCENEQDLTYFLLACSLQIGTILHVLRAEEEERQVKKQLQQSMALIREQNSILDELSKYDELTSFLNRRGFVEKSVRLLHEREGKKACIFFVDVDHLKQINDNYGHEAGDYAITTTAMYLRDCFPRGTVIGRLGGDEFVALLLLEDDIVPQNIVDEMKSYIAHFNAKCDKPYYIENSIGFYEFTCDAKVELGEVMSYSDKALYVEKEKRRTDISK